MADFRLQTSGFRNGSNNGNSNDNDRLRTPGFGLQERQLQRQRQAPDSRLRASGTTTTPTTTGFRLQTSGFRNDRNNTAATLIGCPNLQGRRGVSRIGATALSA